MPLNLRINFVEKFIFARYLTWIQFVFKLDIFKNNERFDFILKNCLKIIDIYFSIIEECFIYRKIRERQGLVN
jgi:hypothetical protein